MSKRLSSKILSVIFLTMTIAGCAKPQIKKETVFYPPLPNAPRVQYLTSISSDEDIAGKKNSFSLFLTGADVEDKVISIRKPYGVTVHRNKIYVCDIAGKIVVIEPDKKSFDYLDGTKLKGMKKPINVAFDNDDYMYVSDIARKEVLVFDPKGLPVRSIGKEEKIKPSDVAVDEKYLYALDLANSEIKIYDKKTGAYLRAIGRQEGTGKSFGMPTNFTLDKGIIYATNIVTANVVVIDRDGNYIRDFGELGDSFADFARPKGVAVDDEGRIYVVDNGLQQVKIFNNTGRILLLIGGPGYGPGDMNLPIAVAVSKEVMPFFKQFIDPSFEVESLIFVTNQFGSAKLSVYGLGKTKNPDAYQKPPEVKPAEDKPADVKPAEVKPAEAKPAEAKPAEGKPAEGKPAEGKPAGK